MGKFWEPAPIDTYFLLGTGICEGSWAPVRRAILDVDPDAPVDVSARSVDAVSDTRAANDAANFWFADLVHKRRRMAAFAASTDAELKTRLGPKTPVGEFRERLNA